VLRALALRERRKNMGYFVTGIITKETDASKVASVIPFKYFHEINQGYVIFPITDDLIDECMLPPLNFCFDEFAYLSKELSEILLNASQDRCILYLETEYFGGEGCQSAIVYKNKEVVLGPSKSDSGSISEALEFIGVSVDIGHHDAFQSVGLGSFRSSEELLNNA
jgi:hypothetical protein